MLDARDGSGFSSTSMLALGAIRWRWLKPARGSDGRQYLEEIWPCGRSPKGLGLKTDHVNRRQTADRIIIAFRIRRKDTSASLSP